jgi:hypothetical protein
MRCRNGTELGYGTIEKFRTQVAYANIIISDSSFKITYLAKRGIIKQKFIEDKMSLFNGLLNITGIFADGLRIECDTLEQVFVEARTDKEIPRPILENMELLAREIHNDYIANQKLSGDSIYVEEAFDKLEPSSRYSNLRQAMNMDKKMRKLGYALVPDSFEDEAVKTLPSEIIEQYAILEHEDWANGKMDFGWKYAPVRNDEEHLHDCLVPWAELSEIQKDKDRRAAQNVNKLVQLAGMKVIKL